MARTMKPASADTVRAWAADTGWTDEFGRPPKDRGRLNTQLVADFDKAHKRNWIEYRAGYKDDTSAASGGSNTAANNSGNAGGNKARTAEVATRSRNTPAKANTEKATAPTAPVRVQAERVKGEVAQAVGSDMPASIADVIAMLQSAATASGGKTKGMLAYYTLVG